MSTSRSPGVRPSSVPEDAGLILGSGPGAVVLFRVEGEVFAYRNECPHRGGPVGEGIVAAGVVTCPSHGYRFDVRTGACVSRPGFPSLTPAVVIIDPEDGGAA